MRFLTLAMTSNKQSLDSAYASYMRNHPFGTALYSPLPARLFHPGSCGYFDSVGAWNPITDLSSPSHLSTQGFTPVSEELQAAPVDATARWGPKISESAKARKVALSAGISAAVAAAIPADLSAFYAFESSNAGGAVLLTAPPITHRKFYYESPFKGWVRDNAVKLVEKRKEVLRYGLWIVTSTWATENCAINMWTDAGKGVEVGFQTSVIELGELGPSGGWWADGRQGGWVKIKAAEVSARSR